MAKILQGTRTHNLPDEQSLLTVTRVLKPHKKAINRVLKRIQDKRARKNFDLRKQRGGALFSVILAGLVPLIADLIIRAARKKG